MRFLGKETTARNRGSAVAEVAIAAAMLVFVILPVFSAVIEKYLLSATLRTIRDAVDMANISAYNALDASQLGMAQVDVSKSKTMDIYKEVLRLNLKLDEQLDPLPGSVAEGRVEVDPPDIYLTNFPQYCPNGTVIDRPSVHSIIRIPVKPSLYRAAILGLLGKDHVDVEMHVDTEIPVNK